MADREKILRYFKAGGDEQLAAKLLDLAEGANKSRKFRVSEFLDPHAYNVAEIIAANYENVRLESDGGFSNAERVKAAFVADDFYGQPDFGMAYFLAAWDKRYYDLSHRDILGAFMGTGCKREALGDIVFVPEGAQFVVEKSLVAAAGSDARMNGCEMPVVINSGSGNQGITTSVPVIVYAKELGASEEKRYRALTLANLTTIHVKTPIGRLSAYCGAVGAGAGAGAGIAYLCGGGFKEVEHTVVNALAIVSGIVCDGAKASCAAKIASAVDAGILGYNMYIRGQQFRSGDGIVSKGIESTLQNVGRLGKEGMKETNDEIIKIMIGE